VLFRSVVGVELYPECDFGGDKTVKPVGEYDWSGPIKSIRVPSGYSVKLTTANNDVYSTASFDKVKPAEQPCLTNDDFITNTTKVKVATVILPAESCQTTTCSIEGQICPMTVPGGAPKGKICKGGMWAEFNPCAQQ
jgi:hypothetical protein